VVLGEFSIASQSIELPIPAWAHFPSLAAKTSRSSRRKGLARILLENQLDTLYVREGSIKMRVEGAEDKPALGQSIASGPWG
jgi:hypothetical protein